MLLGHIGRQCTAGGPCSESSRYEHQMLYSFCSKQTTNRNTNMLSREGGLLKISSVFSHMRQASTLRNSGRNITLIANRMAKHLGLKGRGIELTAIKVSNECTKLETQEFDVPLRDCLGEKNK